MRASGKSLVGRRDNNEDAFLIREDLGLFVVADGMGGHEGGEVASGLVAESLDRFFSRTAEVTNPAHREVAAEQMNMAIRIAHNEVERRATGRLADMGTTLAALWMRDESAFIAHVGDSRVYRFRNGRLERMTSDHSFLQELRASGAIRATQQLPGQLAAMVTRCIAVGANAEADVLLVDAAEGDVFLLCSDGLTDVVDDREIAAVLQTHDDPEQASSALATLAYEAGSLDNITTLVVRA